MRIRCKGCGAQYFVKDDLITEKGIRVRCSKCGTTFIVKKRRRRIPTGPALPKGREEQDTVDPEKVLELVQEKGFFQQFKEAGWGLKAFFFLCLLSLATLAGYSAYRFFEVRAQERFIYGAVALKYGYVEDAIEELKKLVDSRPRSLAYNFLLAEALGLLKRPEARRFYRKAAMLAEDKGVKGSLLVRAGSLREGISLLKTALLVSDDPAAVSNDLGIALLMLGDERGGLGYLEDASSRYPYHSLYNMGEFAVEKGRNPKVVERLYSTYSTNAEVLINTAVFYAKRGDYSRALGLLFMAKGEHKYAPIVWHDIGVIYRLMGDVRYRAYMQRDAIRSSGLVTAGYLFLLNPEVRLR